MPTSTQIAWTLVSAAIVVVGIVASRTASDPIAHWIRDQSFKVTPRWMVHVVAAVAVAGALVGLASRRSLGRRALQWVSAAARRTGDALSVVPPAVILTAMVVLVAVARIALGTVEVLPRVLGDELVYSGLAKGVALDGVPSLRGHITIGYSLLAPLVWAPGYALTSTGVDGYEVARAVNAVALALTAVPTYLLSKRVTGIGWGLVAAACTVFAPWGAYSALMMTESLFYLGFAIFALALVRTLESPTAWRQLVSFGTVCALVAVRPQALVLAGALVGAYVLAAALDGRLRELPSTYWVTLIAFGALAAGAFVAEVSGLPLPAGKYGALLSSDWGFVRALKWALWNVAAIEAAFGVVALVAFPVALRRLLRRSATTSEQAVGVVSLSLTLAVLASVAVLSASPYGLGVLHERNLFYVAPLVFVCFFSWLPRSGPRVSRLALGSAAVLVALALLLPTDLVQGSNNVDGPTAVLLREVGTVGGLRPTLWLGIAAVLAALALLVGRSVALPIIAIVIGFVGVTAQMDYEAHLERQAVNLDWVDRSLPEPARATLLNVGVPPSGAPCAAPAEDEQQQLVVWTEFLNTRVDRVLRVFSPSAHDNLASPELAVGDGGVLLEDGMPLDEDFVAADSRQPLVGRPVARLDLRSLVPSSEGASLTLWSVDPPLRLAAAPSPIPPRPDGTAC